MKSKKIYFGLAVSLLIFSACANQEQEFPDFDYQTVYFANQYALRILELGEDDIVDNSMDNQHKVTIKAVMGGAYTNTKTRTIDITVDNSLCDNLYFKSANTPVLPMPANYYQLAANRIEITSGNIQGGVEVQLTDAFFEDAKALASNYVIPIVMTGAQGVDSILHGQAYDANADRFVTSDWSVLPKDYVLYGVKYVNPWHGTYLRRGTDTKTLSDASTQTVSRHAPYVENDEVVNITTNQLKEATLALTAKDASGTNVPYNLRLKFADDGTCTVESPSTNFTISGTGKFVSKGEKNSLGGKDRNALYLDYTVDFIHQNMKYVTKDTLVLRERGVYGAGVFEVEKR
ncbi:MAG: DUF5627 domain-containing protein [Dysgonamonadaceae bacterium]|jgi:hypothetical protein|nr:DUF5627 domain-containing protein [Dysgonamonadaceae bacterium]